MRHSRYALLCLATALVIGGATDTTVFAAQPGIVLTRSDPAIPRACEPLPIARRVAAFFRAFSRGDVRAATARVNRQGSDYGFAFSLGEQLGNGRTRSFVARSPQQLASIIRQRRPHGDRMRLPCRSPSGWSAVDGPALVCAFASPWQE